MNRTNFELHDNFRRVGALMRRERHKERMDGNYPSTQKRALTILSMNDGMSQRQLSFVLGIRPQSSGEIVFKMEEKGWITRVTDEADNRVHRIFLTEEGKKQAELIVSAEGRNDVFDCLSEDEKATLNELLGKVVSSYPAEDHKPRCRRHFREGAEMEVRNMPFVREGFEPGVFRGNPEDFRNMEEGAARCHRGRRRDIGERMKERAESEARGRGLRNVDPFRKGRII